MSRVAVVSGGASGIGRATVLRLLQDPALTVLAIDVDGAGLEAMAGAAAGLPGSCETLVVDVSASAECERAIEAAAQLGTLELLVNVAGVMAAPDSVEALDDATIRRVWEVNVGSVFALSRAAIPRLRGSGGAIVNVSSVHAFAAMADNAVYAASKGAIVALTRQMALDLAPDAIRVVGVAPGSVDTAMTRVELDRRGVSPEQAGFATDGHSIGRMMRPQELAETIAWVGSPAASSVNGTTVVADAGLLARLV